MNASMSKVIVLERPEVEISDFVTPCKKGTEAYHSDSNTDVYIGDMSIE